MPICRRANITDIAGSSYGMARPSILQLMLLRITGGKEHGDGDFSFRDRSGKNSCSVVGLNRSGEVVLRRRLHRENVIKVASDLAPCVVAMEACCGAHHLGRILRDQGHQIRLMSPEYVRPYVSPT